MRAFPSRSVAITPAAITRRQGLMLGAAAAIAGLPPSQAATPYAGAVRIRPDAASPQGQTMLEAYAQAVAQMKQAPEGSPLSWRFQHYTHWVSGPGKDAEIQRIFGAPDSPDKMLALAMWSTCRGHFNWSPQLAQFLSWHRMYVLRFEAIVAHVLRMDHFALPYWDYTNADDARRAIPEAFRRPDDPAFASLFVATRKPGVNQGAPIASAAELNLNAMLHGDYDTFNELLDGTPHGTVHVRVGTTANMGAVPTAANDPIFWLHHANIDRIWESWRAAGGTDHPADGPWGEAEFTFAAADGQPAPMRSGEVLDIGALGYGYQDLLQPPGPISPPSEAPPIMTMAQAESPAAPIVLGPEPVTVALSGAEAALGARLESVGDGDERYLVIVSGLRAAVQPGATYGVFLGGDPADIALGEDAPNFAGAFTFFNAPTLEEGQAGQALIDVTDAVRALAETGAAAADVTAVIAPLDPAEGAPQIEGVTLIRR